MGEEKTYTNQTHVPDKVYSFSLQIRHMLNELIKAQPGDIISLEALDDVAIQNNEENELIQIKSSISKNNPTSDRAVDFWKTFYNWFEYVKYDGIELEKTKFRLVIHTTKNKELGQICRDFNDANNISEVNQALEIAIRKIKGNEKEIPESYKKYIDTLFDEENREIVIGIILNFKANMEIDSKYEANLLKNLRNKILIDTYVDKIFIYMLGWINEEVNKETKLGKPAFIEYVNFEKELKSQLTMYIQDNVLQTISVEVEDSKAEEEIKKEDIYIKQLNLINVKYEEKISAVKAFLRTSIDKTEWADRGLVTSISFNEYENSLIERWNNSKNLIELENLVDNYENSGKKLYYTCLNSNLTKLQGKDLPSYFVKGEYNQLANKLVVGWHFKYKELLLNEKKEECKNE